MNVCPFKLRYPLVKIVLQQNRPLFPPRAVEWSLRSHVVNNHKWLIGVVFQRLKPITELIFTDTQYLAYAISPLFHDNVSVSQR